MITVGEDDEEEVDEDMAADDDCEVIVDIPDVGVDAGFELEVSVAAVPDGADCESVGVKEGVGVEEKVDSGSVNVVDDASPDDVERDKMDPGRAERELDSGGGGKVGIIGPTGPGKSEMATAVAAMAQRRVLRQSGRSGAICDRDVIPLPLRAQARRFQASVAGYRRHRAFSVELDEFVYEFVTVVVRLLVWSLAAERVFSLRQRYLGTRMQLTLRRLKIHKFTYPCASCGTLSPLSCTRSPAKTRR